MSPNYHTEIGPCHSVGHSLVKNYENKCWERCGEKMWRKKLLFFLPRALLVGIQTSIAAMKNSMAFPHKVKNRNII